MQWDVCVFIRRWSRSCAHRRIPNTHSMTDLSESHGASQIEVPNIGNTKNAMYANVFLSVSLERKFLVEVQRRQFSAVQRQFAKITKRNNTTMEKVKSSTRGFLRKCQPPTWQRFPCGTERQEREGRSAMPKRRERSRIRSQIQPSAQERVRKNSAVLHTLWRQKAMVPKEVRAHCSVVRLATNLKVGPC